MDVDPEETKKRILYLIGSINIKGKKLLGDSITLITSSSLEIYNISNHELGFIRSIAWLYSIYFETGKENIRFLSQKFSLYEIPITEEILTHKSLVNNLRTSLQHNTAEETEHNLNIRQSCVVWYNDHCQHGYPCNEADWKKCLSAILGEAELFFRALDHCLNKIFEDKEYLEIIVSDWKKRINRYHPPADFDRIIEKVAVVFGRDDLDIVKFREKYYPKWLNKLKLLKECDFEVEVRSMVEQDLVENLGPKPMVDGSDIMTYFGIPPSKKVGELSRLRDSLIVNKKYSTKEELLKALNKEAKSKGIL